MLPKNFSAEMDIVDLLALTIDEVEARINACDVIFVVGGSADYQMSVFNKTGFSKLLPKLLETKVYVGSSAGAMVMGKRLSAEAYKVMYGQHGTFGIDTYLELVDFVFMPHLDSPEFPGRKQTLIEAAKNYSGVVRGFQDDSALVVNGDQQQFIGSQPVTITNGQFS